jgi:putative NIF3 family GTP cyclohydrolase 1 type 2
MTNHKTRRQFLNTMAGVTGITVLSGSGMHAQPIATNEGISVQQVIDLFLKEIPGAPFKQTVDTLKAGEPSQLVTGIVTTMFATIDVIRQAAALGANFIIAHEPTFYNHSDDTGWLENDSVYRYKRNLLQQHGIAVWRNHDYIHTYKPDGVIAGVLQALGWEANARTDNRMLVNLDAMDLGKIIVHCKKRLGISQVKYIGQLNDACNRILFIPGAAGGRMQISSVQQHNPDLLICGELNEWETSEYIRDRRAAGTNTSLLVLGHVLSEEPGSEWMANWLRAKLPSVKINHIPSGDALQWG